jgi:hypothetical protein
MVGSDRGKRKRRWRSAPPSKPTAASVINDILEEDAKRQQNSVPLFPPKIKTEFDRLCEDFGGPADIGIPVGNLKSSFRRYCGEYRLGRVRPILDRFQEDDVKVRRHWPWVAFAVCQYRFQRREFAKYTSELSPAEVLQLLDQIEKAAHDLSAGLNQLQKLSHRLADPSAPFHRGHLAWIDAYVSQAAAGRIGKEVNESPEELVLALTGKMELIKRLAEIEATAHSAKPRTDRKLLTRERGQSESALPRLVFHCAVIWKSLTGREPSANKVTRRDGTEDPDFVIFVQKLAEIGGTAVPSRRQVATSLGKISTPN